MMRSEIEITERNCLQVCKEQWAWLAEHYPKAKRDSILGRKMTWPEWANYSDCEMLCPLCEVYNNTGDDKGSRECIGCPLQEIGASPDEQGCYNKGYADFMSGEDIIAFNKVIQGLKQ